MNDLDVASKEMQRRLTEGPLIRPIFSLRLLHYPLLNPWRWGLSITSMFDKAL